MKRSLCLRTDRGATLQPADGSQAESWHVLLSCSRLNHLLFLSLLSLLLLSLLSRALSLSLLSLSDLLISTSFSHSVCWIFVPGPLPGCAPVSRSGTGRGRGGYRNRQTRRWIHDRYQREERDRTGTMRYKRSTTKEAEQKSDCCP